MTYNTKISIIIPVYNASKYLEECIDSLLNQTFSDFEIICVDDGSTDDSYLILKQYEKKDSRISVYTQKNEYAGVARNNGMKKANGKYLLFLDADDFFGIDMLEKLWNQAEETQSEIVVYDAFLYDDQTKSVHNKGWRALQKTNFEGKVKAAREMADSIFDFTVPAPWNKLFLHDFIKKNELWFQPLKRTNDLCFVYSALSVANRISILDEKLMYYRDNNSSSLQGKGEQTPEIFLEALKGLREHLLVKDIWTGFKTSYKSMSLTIAFHNLNNMKTKDNYLLLYGLLKKENFFEDIEKNELQESLFLKEIQLKKEIIIYGAGAVAKSVINFLINVCDYEKEKIQIVVSNVNQNNQSLCNIKIRFFDELEEGQKDRLVVVAINEKAIQQIIENAVLQRGFAKVEKVGYAEIANIMRGYVS